VVSNGHVAERPIAKDFNPSHKRFASSTDLRDMISLSEGVVQSTKVDFVFQNGVSTPFF
jgi:hypothetical protein